MKMLRLAVSTGAVSGISILIVWQLLAQESRVPLTLEATEQSFGPDGSLRENRVIIAIRGDGSHVRTVEYRGADGGLREVRSIVDLNAGRRTVVASATKSTTTYFYTKEQISGLRARTNYSGYACPDNNPETDLILGYEVIAGTTDLEGAPGQTYKGVAYYAPALGCIPLDKILSQVEADGSETISQPHARRQNRRGRT